MIDGDAVRARATESAAVQGRFFAAHADAVVAAGRRFAEIVAAGGRLFSLGNGGSAADAQHFAAELVGRFLRERRAIPALALTTDPSVITALANDLGYERVFVRQLEAHGRAGDGVLAISTSGRSPNVLAAARYARATGMYVVSLTGRGGGDLAPLADVSLDVESQETQRIQEVHAMVVHCLCEIIEERA